MLYRFYWLSLALSSIFLLSGCWTSSRVDEFVQQHDADTQIGVWTPTTQTGNSWFWVQSDDTLLKTLQGSQEDSSTVRWSYEDYTSELIADAKQSKKKVIIVVTDPSCDNCTKLDYAINTSLSRIPSDVLILRLDYGQARELYQVKEMNTVIAIDTSGEQSIISDGWIYTMESLLYYL